MVGEGQHADAAKMTELAGSKADRYGSIVCVDENNTSTRSISDLINEIYDRVRDLNSEQKDKVTKLFLAGAVCVSVIIAAEYFHAMPTMSQNGRLLVTHTPFR